ncbi:MAG TPA: sigma 54-interacting transcriptional regulator [Terriglobales bacterium]|nr:sigma 54-interacting transcriptional regulator [Terriglobales bacterium]
MADLSELIGRSDAIEAVRSDLRKLLALARDGRRLPAILIDGETGTGKGLVAKLLHRHGPRARGPFVDINCAAIPETLLEAELFGYERGAFTDARQAKQGLFQAASGGVLFLDEIGVLPETLQAKLLTVIEEKAVRRLGRTTKETFDTWLVSATNADLGGAVRARRFREDLYHRIAVLTVRLPPLRERPGDAVLLAERFLERACVDYGVPARRLSPEVRAMIAADAWPGNVRELANVVERLALLMDGTDVTAADFANARGASVPVAPAAPPAASAPGDDRERLLAALEATGWNIVRTAATLGLARNTVRARMDRYGLRGMREARATAAAAAAPAREARTEPAAAAPARPAAPPASAGVRWDVRHVTLLRVAFGGSDTAVSDAGDLVSLAADKVAGFGGRIERLGGTLLDASFGVAAVESAPRRAVSAALAIQRAVTDAARPGLAVRTVVDTEQTTVGHVAGHLVIEERQRAALLASLDRVTELVTPGGVHVTARTAPFLERYFELRYHEPVGPTAEPTYTVLRRDPTGVGLWRRATRFVGRDLEMSLLRARWDLARGGRGQVVGVVGEAGTGKSRLLLEFVRNLDLDRALVLPSGTSAVDDPSRTPPAAALVGALFGIEAADGREAVRTKIATRLDALTLGHALLAPLVALLDPAVDDADWLALTAPQRVRRTQEALRRLIVHESATRPIVMVLDDVHWIDADTQVTLDQLVDVISTAHILLVVAYRPEYRHGWTGRTFYTQIPLGALPAGAAGQLLDDLLGNGEDLVPLKQRLVSWTEGNPFFIEEAIRTLVSLGTLGGAPGAYRVTGEIVEQTLPATVEDALAARIHRLPTDVRHVLQCAALIGTDFSLPVVAAVAGVPEAGLAATVRVLQDAELVYPVTDAREGTYQFRHTLTHFVTCRSLPPERQRALHGEIVRAMQRLYADQLDAHTETLAEHAFRAESWALAGEYLHAAGRRAAARSANRAVIDYLERAVVALDRAERRRDLVERAIDVRLDLRYALSQLGHPERTLPRLREAEALATEIGDTHRLGRVASFLANGLYLLGDHGDAIAAAGRARAIAAERGDFETRTAADIYAGRALYALGRYAEANEHFTRVVESLDGPRATEYAGLPVLPAAYARSYLAMGLAELGDFETAQAVATTAVAIADASQQLDTIQWASYALGVALLDGGDVEAATASLERALSICRAAELPVYVPRAAAALGHAYVLLGRGEGAALVAAAASGSRTSSHRNIQARILARLAAVSVLTGKAREGIEQASEALSIARDHGERGSEAHARHALATAHAGDGRHDDARASFATALALADELGMRAVAGLCHLGLGRVCRALGARADAEAHLDAAHDAFVRLGRARWRQEAADERQRGG